MYMRSSQITPSLPALDDAQALRKKEWRRGEPGEDIPWQYSTVCRHLIPTQPRHEDIRMDSIPDVTPEGSLSDLPAAMRVLWAIEGNKEHKKPLRLR